MDRRTTTTKSPEDLQLEEILKKLPPTPPLVFVGYEWDAVNGLVPVYEFKEEAVSSNEAVS